jgi:hypothetical protein
MAGNGSILMDQDKVDELLKIIGISQYQAFQLQKEIDSLKIKIHDQANLLQRLQTKLDLVAAETVNNG